jgi:hypothetical protein
LLGAFKLHTPMLVESRLKQKAESRNLLGRHFPRGSLLGIYCLVRRIPERAPRC